MHAKIILDSISPDGDRLTTMEVRMHRFVLAEFNTHRVFSRNSASSRAIPILKRIKEVWNSLAWPVEWGSNRPGMQAGAELEGVRLTAVKSIWKMIAVASCGAAWLMHRLGLHKQVANRVLEPFLWHTVLVTSTEWDNYFYQRCSPLAQPEIRAVSEAMHRALQESKPKVKPIGSWHTPYVSEDEQLELAKEYGSAVALAMAKAISTARCARVSYKSFAQGFDNWTPSKIFDEDLKLFTKLTSAKPIHWSPLEHVATPYPFSEKGNFKGWLQFRHSGEL